MGLVVAVCASCAGARVAGDGTRGDVFAPTFAGPDRLVTNERAHPTPPRDGHVSADWVVTSGSLFARGGAGWSGEPDGGSPDAGSTPATGSAVLRAVSRGPAFSGVTVTTQVRVVRLLQTERTPVRAWDGVHLFLRYQSPDNTYTVDVHRRDGSLTVKRKSGGRYTTLGRVDHRVPRGRWLSVRAEARTARNGDVRITSSIDGQPVLGVTDRSDAAITGAGRVGIRGDNCEFYFRDYRAWSPRG